VLVGDDGERLGRAGGLADDGELGLALQHRAQALADDGVVVDEHDDLAHGISQTTRRTSIKKFG